MFESVGSEAEGGVGSTESGELQPTESNRALLMAIELATLARVEIRAANGFIVLISCSFDVFLDERSDATFRGNSWGSPKSGPCSRSTNRAHPVACRRPGRGNWPNLDRGPPRYAHALTRPPPAAVRPSRRHRLRSCPDRPRGSRWRGQPPPVRARTRADPRLRFRFVRTRLA